MDPFLQQLLNGKRKIREQEKEIKALKNQVIKLENVIALYRKPTKKEGGDDAN